MSLKLVKGKFSSLEEALRAQVVMMQKRIDELEDDLKRKAIEHSIAEQHCYHCGKHYKECCEFGVWSK